MRFSLNWLREWVPGSRDAEQLAECLTAAGLEVDSVQSIGAGLDGVVVARIVECRPHPDADRLQVCEVDAGGDGPVQVVCGAPNARAGLVAPLATVGARLPNGLTIRVARLRGVESSGMLCSATELGLGEDSSGLLELDPALKPGTALATALGLPDHVIEVDLTPNRADCLSIRGLARELAAIEQGRVIEPLIEPVPAVTDSRPAIELQAPDDCPRYVGRIIEDLDPAAPTPSWMRTRLERSGLRCRGALVDVTNYVMLELGQPMHAFDLDKLDGGIRVRRATGQETMTLLDGQKIVPESDELLICDHSGPVALAGIMGGADSAVGDQTRRILLESAWFNPASIVGRARRHGLSTDSSHRFERGVDPKLQHLAIERATALLVQIAGGRPGPVVEACHPSGLPKQAPITLRLSRVNRVLGTCLGTDEIRSLLERLGMQVEASGDDRFNVKPPSARMDLAGEIDLIEEVARLHGYDALPIRSPRGRLQLAMDSERALSVPKMRCILAARGFQEVVTWSFVSEGQLALLGELESAQPLANPLNRDMAVLRTTLLPGLLAAASRNWRHGRHRLRLFEVGHVFRSRPDWSETQRLALLMAGPWAPEGWANPAREVDVFDLKGELMQLFLTLGLDADGIEVRASGPGWLHPGQSMEMLRSGQVVGWAGQLHPELVDGYDLDTRVHVAEIDLAALGLRELPQYRPVARYPAVRRDLALIVPEEVRAAELLGQVSAAAGELLEDIVLFDLYHGDKVETGLKSVAIGLILRDLSGTLTDERVDGVIDRVVTRLAQQCGASLRGS
ncbi:MAG: phenylalanine--tRNA ligase subunit beta [Wenzhouxiangellaceae bacterium]